MNAEKLQELVGRLSPLKDLDETSIGVYLGVKLRRRDDPSNPYFRMFRYEAATEDSLKYVELRLPADEESATGTRLLIIRFAPDPRLDISASRAVLGVPSGVVLPSPRAPAETPVYDTYTTPYGKLSVGFLASKGNAVSEVILESN